MEALTYDRARAFAEFLPPDEYKTWQPKKLMAVLLDIDPTIGLSSTLRFGIEEVPGTPAPPEAMRHVGTDHVLSLADIKKHYDAIGSYLHVPSLAQLKSENLPDLEKLRDRCETIVASIEQVLSSTIWNSTIGGVVTFQCANNACKKPVRKRMPVGKDSIEVQCFECKAEYTVTSTEGDTIKATPKVTYAPCSTSDCGERFPLWGHEVKPGTHWRCRACGAHNGLTIQVAPVEPHQIVHPHETQTRLPARTSQ